MIQERQYFICHAATVVHLSCFCFHNGFFFYHAFKSKTVETYDIMGFDYAVRYRKFILHLLLLYLAKKYNFAAK